MTSLKKLSEKLQRGVIETNERIGFPQVQTAMIGHYMYYFYYDWNYAQKFLVLTIKYGKYVIFKNKLIIGNQYILYATRRLFKETGGIKTIATFTPTYIDATKCTLDIIWQVDA